MSGPFIFIGTSKIREGKLEECKQRLQELVDLVETNEPRLIAFNLYLDEKGSRLSAIQVHPDAESMEYHMKVVSEHLSNAFEFLESTESQQVYGQPTPALAQMLSNYDANVAATFMPVYEGGFTRTNTRWQVAAEKAQP